MIRNDFFGVFGQVEDAICSVVDNISFAEIQKLETEVLSFKNSGDTYLIDR